MPKKSKLSSVDITALLDAKYILSELVVPLLVGVASRNPKSSKAKDLLRTVQHARQVVYNAITENEK